MFIFLKQKEQPSEESQVQQSIDYDRLANAIVEANRIICKEAKEEKEEEYEKDVLAHSIVRMFEWISYLVITIIVMLILVMAVKSCCDAKETLNQMCGVFELTVIFWICLFFFAIVMIKCALSDRPKNEWSKLLGTVIILTGIPTVGIPLYFMFGVGQDELATLLPYCFTAALVIAFLVWLIRAVKKETDRHFLVSYFSAIIAISALLISVVNLFR